MSHYRFLLKILSVLLVILILSVVERAEQKEFLSVTGFFLLSFAIFFSIAKRFVSGKIRSRHLDDFPFYYPGLILLLSSFFLSPWTEPVNPPPLWYSLPSSVQNPDYNHALFVKVKINDSTGRYKYLTTSMLTHQEEKKTQKIRIKKNTKKYYRKKNEKYNRYKKYSKKKKRYRPYYYKRISTIIRSELSPEEKIPFPLFLRINDDSLFHGCELILKVSGRAVPTHPPANSYGRYIKRLGMTTMLRASAKYHVVSSVCPKPSWSVAIRRKILHRIQNSGYSKDVTGAALGMLLGDSSYMDRGLRKKSTGAGIMHLFAASGLHLGIFYGSIYAPLAFLFGKRSFVAMLLPLPFAFALTAILGFPLTLVRAFLFLLFHAMKCLIHRPIRTGDHIVNAAIGMLLLLPDSFLSLSTAFSFGAVTGILYFFPVVRSVLGGKDPGILLGFISTQVGITISATLLLIPLTVGIFGMHSFISSLINFFAVPLASLILPGLYLGVFLDLVGVSQFSSLLLFASGIGLRGFVWLAKWGDLPGSYRNYSGLFSFPVLVGITLIMFLVFLRFRPQSGRRVLLFLRAGIIICMILLSPPGALVSKKLEGGKFWGTDRAENVTHSIANVPGKK